MASKTYYSRFGLSMPVTEARWITVDGQAKQIEARYIQFARIGSDKYFMFTTNEPDVQAVLDARLALDGSDIFDAEEYQKLVVPAEMRVNTLKEEVLRVSAERNRLLVLLDQQKSSAPPAIPPQAASLQINKGR